MKKRACQVLEDRPPERRESIFENRKTRRKTQQKRSKVKLCGEEKKIEQREKNSSRKKRISKKHREKEKQLIKEARAYGGCLATRD